MPDSHANALMSEAEEAARLCFGLAGVGLKPLRGGRVNESFVLESGHGRFVLQKLNDVFKGSPSLGLNWKALCEAVRLRGRGGLEKSVPDIFPDLNGSFTSAPTPGGPIWRLTAHISGRPAPLDPTGARPAARLLGALHRLLNCPAPFSVLPPPEGELTNQRLTRPEDFEDIRFHYRRHPHLEEISPLLAQGEEAAWLLPQFPAFLDVFQLRESLVHGDPKADNFIFSPDGQALALVDWDNLRYGHVLSDVAEMLRSWGQPAGIEAPAGVCLENMAAVLAGYAETGLPLSPRDISLLPAVLRGISLTLARRYLTDALAEVFFKWDCERYPSLYIQNKTRAKAMLDLAEYLLNHEMRLAEIFQAAYRPAPE